MVVATENRETKTFVGWGDTAAPHNTKWTRRLLLVDAGDDVFGSAQAQFLLAEGELSRRNNRNFL